MKDFYPTISIKKLKENQKKYLFYLQRARKQNPPSENKIKYWQRRLQKTHQKIREAEQTKIVTYKSIFGGEYSLKKTLHSSSKQR